jgi:hypothetical protein
MPWENDDGVLMPMTAPTSATAAGIPRIEGGIGLDHAGRSAHAGSAER